MSKPFAMLLAVAALAAPAPLPAQGYPAKPVRIVVGYPPGGPSDILARALGLKLGESLGQQIIVDNRPGASGMIGAELVARSAPDGYTLLLVPATFSVLPSLHAKMPYDNERDLAPVSLVAAAPFILIVHPTLPVKTVRDLIALSRAHPGEINYAAASAGGLPHLAGELFNSLTGTTLNFIPYKGAAPATNDLLAGQVPLMFNNMLSAMPHVKSGRLRAVAVTSLKRSQAVPELPTIAESGIPGFEVSGWYGVLAPAGTAPEVVTRLNSEFNRVARLADVIQRLAGDGVEAVASTPDQFAQYLREETAKWRKVVQRAGIKPE